MYKIDLDKVDPQTPTEFALKKHAETLERELRYHQRLEINNDHNVLLVEEEATPKTIEQFWFKGIVRAGITAVPEGQEIKIVGRSNNLNHFEIGYFISEAELRSTSWLANKLHEINQECLKRISDIYKGE